MGGIYPGGRDLAPTAVWGYYTIRIYIYIEGEMCTRPVLGSGESGAVPTPYAKNTETGPLLWNVNLTLNHYCIYLGIWLVIIVIKALFQYSGHSFLLQ